MNTRDVIIVGAGPAGLAAAIACKRRGLDYEVIEKGVLVNSIFNFPPHMVFFTTPELLEIGGLPLVSPYEKPTRNEALRYYRRVVDALDLVVTLGVTVDRIERGVDDGGKAVLAVHTRDGDGIASVRRARGIVLAIGYYDQPNRLDIPGEDLPHVAHYYSEAHGFYRKRVVVVGGKNSAAETALDLFRSGATVTLVHRQPALADSIKYWVLPDIQNRIKEGSVAARFDARVVEITAEHVIIERSGEQEAIPADAVFLLTGYHPDRAFLERCGVTVDARTGMAAFDAETFETHVPNVFLAGGVMSGRDVPPIFIENGRHHGEKVVGLLAARL